MLDLIMCVGLYNKVEKDPKGTWSAGAKKDEL